MEHVKQLKTLAARMENTLARWSMRNASTTLGEASDAIKTFIGDIKKLEYVEEAQSPQIHEAKRHLIEAWENRDVKGVAKEKLTTATRAIKSVLVDMSNVDKGIKRYNDSFTGGEHEIRHDERFQTIKRRLKGIIDSDHNHPSRQIQLTNIRNTVAGISHEYQENAPVLNLVEQLYDTLNFTVSRVKSNVSRFNLEHAVELVDKIQSVLMRQQRPNDMTLTISDIGRERYAEMATKAANIFYSSQFIHPHKAIYDASAIVSSIHRGLKSHAAYREARIAERALEHLDTALNSSQSPAVKSQLTQMSNPWRHPTIIENVELFLNKISELQIALGE